MEQIDIAGIECNTMRPEAFWQLAKQWINERKLHHVVTLNPEMVMAAQSDSEFKKALAAADVRLPDGAGIIWAQWYLRSAFWPLLPSLIGFLWRNVERITGVDMVSHLAKLCAEHTVPIYLLGGTPSQLAKTAQWLKRHYPQLVIFTSGPHTYSLDGPPEIIADIQAKQPAVLLVAYGAPKQTIWIETWRAALPSVNIAVGVGGAFAIISEELPRAPYFLRTHNLEWLWRLLLEPKRLPRIWQATVRFPILMRSLRLQHKS